MDDGANHSYGYRPLYSDSMLSAKGDHDGRSSFLDLTETKHGRFDKLGPVAEQTGP